MQKKKVLIFSLVYYPRFIGGAEVALKEITDRISEDDIQFDMVTLRLDSSLPKYEKIGNIHIHRIGFAMKQNHSSDSLRFPLFLNKYLFPFIGFLKAARLHKKNKYDAIWSMMASYNGFAALFFKMRFRSVPYLLTLQEGDPFDYLKKRVGILYPLFKRIFTSPDFIQTISNYLAGWARDMGYKGPIEVVPNAVNVASFSKKSSDEKLRELKNKLGKKDGDVYLITTSRLVVKNAVGDVIKALPFLPENVSFLVLGIGYQMEELKRLSKKLNVEGRVKFLGFVPHAQMPQYLHISDIFIRPALSEGFGNSFIEAMAAGIPVIATPVGGIPDFLTDSETGVFCEVENPESIARAVERLLSDYALSTQITANASTMVTERYDWDLIASDMKEKVFNRLFGNPVSK